MNDTESMRADLGAFPSLEDLPSNPQMPDPLVFRDGSPVRSLEEWKRERKPELKALFQHYMYGFAPSAPPIRTFTRSSDGSLFGGAATLKQITIAFGPEETPAIDLLLVLPNTPAGGGTAHRPGVFLGLNFGGNHTVLANPTIRLPEGAKEEDRGKSAADWAIESVVARGYAVATFHTADVAPDRPDYEDGVFPLFDAPGQTVRPADAWGILAAWAWGLQRAIDYLITEDSVDAGRIILFGFSRNGKAALLAGAFDERVRAVVAHQAGCGGSGPSRCDNPEAESVSAITSRFPCWFSETFAPFGGREDRLPFDQNCLVALCAPRPVLFTAGSRDRWANPEGQLNVLRGAHAVYGLHGVDSGLGNPALAPKVDVTLGGTLSYYLRDTGHGVDRDYWEVFADFADKQVGNENNEN